MTMIIVIQSLTSLVRGNNERLKGRNYLFLLVFATLLVMVPWGCSEKKFGTIQPNLALRGHFIYGVPFFKQGDSSCGPAALASVTSYWGNKVSMDQVIAKVYLPQLQGTLPMDMESFLREQGFKTDYIAGTMDELKEQIKK